VQGYFWKDEALWRFRQTASGTHCLVTGTVAAGSRAAPLNGVHDLTERSATVFVHFMGLPPTQVEPSQEVMFMFLAPRDRYEALRDAWRSRAQLRDEVTGVLEPVDIASLLRHADDVRVTFPRTYEEVLIRYVNDMSASDEDASTLPALKRYSNGPDQSVTTAANAGSVTAARAGTDWFLVTDAIPVSPDAYYRVTYDLQIDAGGAAFYVMPGADPKPIASFLRNVPQASTHEGFVIYTGRHPELRLVVTAYNPFTPRAARFDVSNLRVDRVALTR
jgi:hypothetical protein